MFILLFKFSRQTMNFHFNLLSQVREQNIGLGMCIPPLLYRHKCFAGKYTTHKIHTKPHPGLL